MNPVHRYLRPACLILAVLTLLIVAPDVSTMICHAADEREKLEREYHALREDGRYREAIPVATKLLELMRERDASWRFQPDDFLDTSSLAMKLRSAIDPMSRHLWTLLSPATRTALEEYRDATADPRPLEPALVADLNRIIGGPSIHASERFADVTLRPRTTRLLGQNPQGEDLLQLNRLLIEDAYSREISKRQFNTAAATRNLASVYQNLDQLDAAERLLREAIRLFDEVLGPDDPASSYSWDDLRTVHEKRENYMEAEKCGLRALGIVEKAYGPVHTNTASVLSNFGTFYGRKGDYEKSRMMLERALDLRRRLLGDTNISTAITINNLAMLNLKTERFAESENLFLEVLTIVTNALPHGEYGVLLHRRGESQKASELLETVLAARERKRGKDSHELLPDLINLSSVVDDLGYFDKADGLLRRALAISRAHKRKADTASVLHAQGNLLFELGDFAEAEIIVKDALAIEEEIYGADSAKIILSLVSLANIVAELGRREENSALLRRAVRISEQALGKKHTTLADLLNSLGLAYQAEGKFEEASSYFKQARKIYEDIAGPRHSKTAGIMVNQAALLHQMGELEAARTLIEPAVEVARERLGSSDPASARALDKLGSVMLGLGRTNEAIAIARGAQTIHQQALSRVLSFAPERQRLRYLAEHQDLDLLCTLGDGPGIASGLMWKKGVVADSILEDRRLGIKAGSAKLRQFEEAKARYAQLALNQSRPAAAEDRERLAAARDRAAQEIADLERTLAREFTGLGRAREALNVSFQQLQNVLPDRTVYVEFVRYRHDLGRLRSKVHYGALVLAHASAPRWIGLGAAITVDENVRQCRKLARGLVGDAEGASLLRGLYDQVWAGVVGLIPSNTRTIIICPDGELNFLPFGALLTPRGTFLVEEVLLSYVSSPRDLLADASPAPGNSCVVLADPDFGQGPKSGPAPGRSRGLRSSDARSLDSLVLDPLPETRKEAQAINDPATQKGLKVKVLTGHAARESALRQVHSPRILHLATHGFFVSRSDHERSASGVRRRDVTGIVVIPDAIDIPGAPSLSAVLPPDPMIRSGLVLADAGKTLTAWKEGITPPPLDDGIVTAEEVSTLDLEGTWLVTLAACDTGVGEIAAGEGVMGLRRGFALAGTRHLLLTLWRVKSEPTVDFMAAFYKLALSGDAISALAEVQREWLMRLRDRKGLAYAFSVAAPFIISSHGADK
ncbi:MAG: tetratricopeptide repeat protein [Verrucomicrobiales bacterium]|nr:tetratricopeptide repeat protein [Verrucomicrobiales bacterium]